MNLPPATISEMIDALSKHPELIADYEPIDREAVWLETAEGITVQQLQAAIVADIENQKWIFTSLKGGRALIERRETRLIQSNQRGCLFHVSPNTNRAAITKDGLQLGTGGNTRMERKYPERIFFALDLIAAFDFADFQCRRTTEPQPGLVVRGVDEQLLRDLDIWRVRSSESIQLRRDVLFPGRAGWSDQPVPPEQISRVRYWRLARNAWHYLRKRGFV
jgi:hypothetical protein